MKLLFSFLIVILIAVTAGLLAHEDSGYVLIGRGFNTIEMSLSLFTILFVFSFITLYVLIRFVLRSWQMPEQIRHWRTEQRTKKSRKISLQGLINLTQGQWQKAEKMLLRSVKNSDMPLLNYLSAAKAAQKQHSPERRDHYLAMAHKSMPDADFAVKLTQAELQLNYGQYEQALATLVHLHQLAPKHVHIMLLLSRIYQQLNSWEDLKNLIPQLRKYKALPETSLAELEKFTYSELINRSNWQNRYDHLQNLWNMVPTSLKQNEALLKIYAQKLIELEKFDAAERLLRDVLRKHWNADLVHLYGLVKSSAPDKQLAFIETMLKEHEHNPVLLLTLGRLCLQNDLWGKARSYFEASIGHLESAECYKELGLLMEYLNEGVLAAEYFRKGLLLAEGQ